jgi:predicted TIM-barrel fold metal-dependent hydrolase
MTNPFPALAFLRGNTENIDVNRLIFASDSPLEKQEIELKRIELANLPFESKVKILKDNVRTVLSI